VVGAEAPKAADPSKKPYITVTEGMSGHFAVQVWWNPDLGGFWEPWDTGIGRYATQEEAITEAKDWARQDEMEYRAP
jgi:hypothetical protein